MTRVKRGVAASKRRKKILKMAKGYRWRRSKCYRAAKEALLKAGKYSYRDRRNKKRIRRQLWILNINNAARQHNLKYSQLINKMKKKNIALDRKVLSQIAIEHPNIFENLLKDISQ